MTLPSRTRRFSYVALADALLTYAYVFAVNAVPFGRTGPHAAWWSWFGKLWVYELIVPIAAVAAWRGVRQVERRLQGREPWWRLAAEGAIAAAAPIVFIALFESAAVFIAIGQGVLVGAGLGILLTAANARLERVLHLEHRSSDHDAPPVAV